MLLVFPSYASLRLARMLGTKPEHIRAMAALAEAIGVPCGSGMFRLALQAVAFSSQEKIAVRVECLKNTFGWSHAEVGVAVCKFPILLKMSKENLQSKSEFLLFEAELEPAYIAHRSSMLGLSLEGRLRPRYYTLKYLKENGLVKCNRDYYSALMFSEKAFVDKFICPHKEAAPYLAQDYAAACRGEIPTRCRSA
jgi:mTERF domain-containing protein